MVPLKGVQGHSVRLEPSDVGVILRLLDHRSEISNRSPQSPNPPPASP